MHHGPQKPDQLPGHRDDGALGLGAERQPAIERVQAALRLPGVRDDDGRLAALPRLEGEAHFGLKAVGPRRLDERVAAVAVARLGEGAPSFPIAGRALLGNQPQVGHELPRRFKALPVADLGGQHHRHVPRYAAEALQPVHGRSQRRGERELADPAIEFIAPRELVLEQPQVLAVDLLILRHQRRAGRRQAPQPVVMRCAPVGALAIDEAAPGTSGCSAGS